MTVRQVVYSDSAHAKNDILYSWPFERVMFASGNNTERMRMGRIQAKGEDVVDLYAVRTEKGVHGRELGTSPCRSP